MWREQKKKHNNYVVSILVCLLLFLCNTCYCGNVQKQICTYSVEQQLQSSISFIDITFSVWNFMNIGKIRTHTHTSTLTHSDEYHKNSWFFFCFHHLTEQIDLSFYCFASTICASFYLLSVALHFTCFENTFNANDIVMQKVAIIISFFLLFEIIRNAISLVFFIWKKNSILWSCDSFWFIGLHRFFLCFSSLHSSPTYFNLFSLFDI